jgi:hypothetical protein
MKQLNPIPFSQKEEKIDWGLSVFTENEKPFAILYEKNINKVPETTNYRFGFIDLDTKLKFWLFNGNSTANNRVIAIDAFNELQNFIEQSKLNYQSFCYKEYEKRES